MNTPPPVKRSFLADLKRRNVLRAAVLYAGAVWAFGQGLSQFSPALGLPNQVTRWFLIACVIGFPFWIAFAWFYEFTPHGIQRESEAAEDAPSRHSTARKLDFAIIGVMAIAIVLLASGYFVRRNAPPGHAIATSVIPAKSIAVLPFENLSSDKGNAYFADGMQDLILTKLADIGDLKVISRTSTAKYASHPDDLKTIGRQLGVATILEGSVQKAGNQVLINVQLIDANTDSHIWAQSYQRNLTNIFGVEGEVAGKIATALKAKLTPAETARVATIPTRNPAAYDAYLRGEHYREMAMAGHFDALPKAVAAYRLATESDPRFALAWARLALSQGLLTYAGIDSSTGTRQQALANARHALELAPNLPQAHLALGYVYRFDFADYGKALVQFQIAQRGAPNNAEVEAAIGYVQAIEGDVEASVTTLQRAASLDPRNSNLAFSLGLALEELRRYDAAGDAFRRMLAVAPDDPEAYTSLSRLALLQHGDVHAATVWLEQAPSDLQAAPAIVSQRADVLTMARDYSAALEVTAGLHAGGRFLTPMSVLAQRVTINWLAGDKANARAVAQRIVDMAKAELTDEPSEETFGALGYMAQAQAVLGLRADAMRTLDQLDRFESSKFGKHGPYSSTGDPALRALVDLLLGDHAAAIEMLDAALARSYGDSVSVPLLKLNPFWDPLREDPRFQALLKKYANQPAAPAASAAPVSAASGGVESG